MPIRITREFINRRNGTIITGYDVVQVTEASFQPCEPTSILDFWVWSA